MSRSTCAVFFFLLCLPHIAGAQTAPADPYIPISNEQRGEWFLSSVAGPRSLGVGVFTSGWLTAFNEPDEWGRSWSGFAKRYGNREVNVALANGIEAGAGAMWGEDPRYRRLGGRQFGSRVKQAVKLSVLAPGREGNLRVAWARHGGTVVSSVASNAWLPASARTPGATTWRMAGAVLGRMAGNAFEEFWPDVRQLLRR
jgi:hypothetical protein